MKADYMSSSTIAAASRRAADCRFRAELAKFERISTCCFILGAILLAAGIIAICFF